MTHSNSITESANLPCKTLDEVFSGITFRFFSSNAINLFKTQNNQGIHVKAKLNDFFVEEDFGMIPRVIDIRTISKEETYCKIWEYADKNLRLLMILSIMKDLLLESSETEDTVSGLSPL